jgi:hypothetical protein
VTFSFRPIVTGIWTSRGPRKTVIFAFRPGAKSLRSVEKLSAVAFAPSTATISSPADRPSRHAGEPSATFAIEGR